MIVVEGNLTAKELMAYGLERNGRLENQLEKTAEVQERARDARATVQFPAQEAERGQLLDLRA